MVERFNAVARRSNLEFEVWFSTRIAKSRSWTVDETEWEFPYRYLPSVGRGEHPLALPTPLFTRTVPDLLVSLYASIAFLCGSGLARMRGARTAFWAEVTFDSTTTRRSWKETLKSIVLPRADGILTAGRDGSDYVKRYGVADERVFIVPHVIDFDHYAQASTISPLERERIREQLGVRGTTFVYAGRLLPGKGLSYLLDAFAELQRTDGAEVSLLVVGDGPEEESLRKSCREEALANVVFAGFHQSDTLPRLYAAADVFAFPTLGDTFGMVVSEAMACGLPVISTSAAGELHDRVLDGVNGFVVAPADSSALVAPMRRLAGDPELRRAMSEAARRTVEGQSPEVWAAAFDHAVTSILTRRTR
jgi:glycosyltransferase involved in cell wall biosynthesis